MRSTASKIMIGLVIIIVVAFIAMRGDQLVELAETLRNATLLPLFFAAAIQLCKYYCQSWSYHFTFASVGENLGPKTALPLVFGAFFINTVAPSANMAGATLVVDDARRRGIPVGKATSAAILMQITVDSGFMCIMMGGFAILQMMGALAPGWLVCGLIVVVLVGTMATLMILGSRNPQMLRRFLKPIERLVNWILGKFKRKPLAPWTDKIADSFSDAGKVIASNPKVAAKAFLTSIGASSCEVIAFCLCGLAFGVTNFPLLVCGYVVATLTAMLSPVPQGVGLVEAAVLVVFEAFGANAAAGMAAVLVYRSLVFWMPFLIGAVLINTTNTLRGVKANPEGDAAAEGEPAPMDAEPVEMPLPYVIDPEDLDAEPSAAEGRR